jgi:hypothetical protein
MAKCDVQNAKMRSAKWMLTTCTVQKCKCSVTDPRDLTDLPSTCSTCADLFALPPDLFDPLDLTDPAYVPGR